ncbi:MAG: sulfatase-like hydrolase/transferase [Actinomycetota bacterium]|nr:sulfatase-like hydrolase/transferase [Actinomycetota bacterium]
MRTDPESTGRGRLAALRTWLELAGAWNVTIAWPVYQAIASGPEALTGTGLRRPDLLVLILLVSFLAPALPALIVELAGRLAGPTVRRSVFAGFMGLMAGLFCWQQLEGSSEVLVVLLPLGAIALTAWLLVRSEFVRNFVLFLGLAVPVVIVAFLVRYPIWSEAGPHEKASKIAKIEPDTPVVIVVFDELPLAALENSRGKIDRRILPVFAGLADTSNWYPNMTARGTNTVNAVPAIMTGKAPEVGFLEKPPPPGRPEYPDNLCRIAESGGYTLHAYEPITDLCERTFGLGSRVSAAIRRGAGSTDEAKAVRITPAGLAPWVADRLASPFEQPWPEYGPERETAVNRFVDGLPAEKRSFSLLHIALPHIFWQFMPDGTRYESNRFTSADSLTSPPSRAQVNHDMQQMMLQLAYTDRKLGEVIDRMKRDGTWDDALFIVTADHGAGFLPGGNRRILEHANSGWILPVPLLVKFPGQEKGRVIRGGVDSLDIAPTVLGVLGVEPPDELTGTALTDDASPPLEPKVKSHGTFGSVEMNRKLIDRLLKNAVRQRNRVFGDGELFDLTGHPGLIGQDATGLPGLRPLESTPADPAALAEVDLDSPLRPVYYRAVITASGQPGRPLAVSLNGRIVATTRSWTDEASGNEVTGVNLPGDRFREGANEVELFEITTTRNGS